MAFTDLEDSGLLRVGNFITWRVRMLVILRVHGVESFMLRDHSIGFTDAGRNNSTLTVSQLIQAHVEPTLFEQVPLAERGDVRRLLRKLETLALRFRFMDLTADLRNRVYHHLSGEDQRIEINPVKRTATPLPKVTAVSRQLREESMPLVLANAKFCFDCGLTSKNLYLDRRDLIPSQLRQSLSRMPNAYLKHLRTAGVILRHRRSNGDASNRSQITFKFSAESGLTAGYATSLRQDSKNLLEKHVKDVEADRKLLGLRGEAVVLALISNPSLWKFGTLEMARP